MGGTLDNLEQLEEAFEKALIIQLKTAQKSARYNPGYVLKLVTECGHLEAARQLLSGGINQVNPEFVKLWEKKMLNLSVEAMICQPRWQPLFTEEELAIARGRLNAYGE